MVCIPLAWPLQEEDRMKLEGKAEVVIYCEWRMGLNWRKTINQPKLYKRVTLNFKSTYYSRYIYFWNDPYTSLSGILNNLYRILLWILFFLPQTVSQRRMTSEAISVRQQEHDTEQCWVHSSIFWNILHTYVRTNKLTFCFQCCSYTNQRNASEIHSSLHNS